MLILAVGKTNSLKHTKIKYVAKFFRLLQIQLILANVQFLEFFLSFSYNEDRNIDNISKDSADVTSPVILQRQQQFEENQECQGKTFS